MTGPFTAFPTSDAVTEQMWVAASEAYRVVAPFTDADGHVHPAGERWRSGGVWYDAGENAVVLAVQLEGVGYWRIPLSWGDAAQRDVIDRADRYLAPDPDAAARVEPPSLSDGIASWGRTLARIWRQRFPRPRGRRPSD